MVEDERTINDALAQRLRAEGYTVEQAFDGPSAVEAAAAVKPDVVLLDVMLPEQSGFDLLRALRARPGTPPVVMVTAKGAEADRVLGLDLGADDRHFRPSLASVP